MLPATLMRYTLIVITFLTISCKQNLQDPKSPPKTDTITILDTTLKGKVETGKTEPVEMFEYQTERFEIEKYYTKVLDTTSFIKSFEENCHLYSNDRNHKQLDRFKRLKLNGSAKDYYYIEYSFPISSNAEFPGRYQIVLDSKGIFLQVISAVRVDIVKILPAESPYLFALLSTAHGYG